MTHAIQLPAGVSEMLTEIGQWDAESVALVIDSDPTLAAAVTGWNRLRDIEKAIETARKEQKQPWLDGGRAVDAAYKPALDTLAQVRAVFDGKITNYRREAEARALAEQRRIEAERSAALAAALSDRQAATTVDDRVEAEMRLEDLQALTPVAAEAPTLDGAGVRTYWSAEVIDADLVPREFCVPDTERLNRIARESKGTRRIPGVRMVMRQSLARSRS